MISYCDVPLPLDTPELMAVIARGVDLSAYKPFPIGYNDDVPPGFLKFPRYSPPDVKVGRFTWPADINAWATAYYLIGKKEYDKITSDQSLLDPADRIFGMKSLYFNDGTDVAVYRMHMQAIHPVALDCYLMVLVDDRFFAQQKLVNGLFSLDDYFVDAGDLRPVEDLETDMALNVMSDSASLDTSDALPNMAYNDLFTPLYRVRWLHDDAVIAHRHFVDPTDGASKTYLDTLTAPQSSAWYSSLADADTFFAGVTDYSNITSTRMYSLPQYVMNSAAMLGYRVVCYSITASTSDSPHDWAEANTRYRLVRPDFADTRDADEVDKWKHKALYGSHGTVDHEPYGSNLPYIWPEGIAPYAGNGGGGIIPAGALEDDGTNPAGYSDIPYDGPNGLLHTYESPWWIASVDIDNLYSTNYNHTVGSPTSQMNALGLQVRTDFYNWRKSPAIDITYSGIVPFDIHGTVYELQVEHTGKTLITKVVPYPRQAGAVLTPMNPRTTNFMMWSKIYPTTPTPPPSPPSPPPPPT